jgi:putative transposase
MWRSKALVKRQRYGATRHESPEKSSNRRKQAVFLLAKARLLMRLGEQDFHHKTALAIVRANDTIYHEDLQTANMLKNHHPAKASMMRAGVSS